MHSKQLGRGTPCFGCGYDLTGLVLPHHCPECGTLMDPERNRAEANAWFCGRAAFWDFLFHPGHIPVAAMYLLDAPEAARVARRRRRFAFWPPILCTLLVAVFGTCAIVDVRVRTTYYDSTDPQRLEFGKRERVAQVRPFVFEVRITAADIWAGILTPKNWIRVDREWPIGLSFGAPRPLEPMVMFLVAAPIAMIVGIYGGTRLVASVFRVDTGDPGGSSSTECSSDAPRTFPAQLVCVSLWLWVAATLLCLAGACFLSTLGSAGRWLMLQSVIAAAVLNWLGWVRVVRLDRARIVYPSTRAGLLLALPLPGAVVVGGVILLML